MRQAICRTEDTYAVGIVQASTEQYINDEAAIAGSSASYSIVQLSRELGITARTLRFYEASARDRAPMIIILRGSRLGLSLREIKEYLNLYDADRTQKEQLRILLRRVGERRDLLENQRLRLGETLAELTIIEQKVQAALAKFALKRE